MPYVVNGWSLTNEVFWEIPYENIDASKIDTGAPHGHSGIGTFQHGDISAPLVFKNGDTTYGVAVDVLSLGHYNTGAKLCFNVPMNECPLCQNILIPKCPSAILSPGQNACSIKIPPCQNIHGDKMSELECLWGQTVHLPQSETSVVPKYHLPKCYVPK